MSSTEAVPPAGRLAPPRSARRPVALEREPSPGGDLDSPSHFAAFAAGLEPSGFHPRTLLAFDRIERERGAASGLDPWRKAFAHHASAMSPQDRQSAIDAVALYINGGLSPSFGALSPAEVLALPEADTRHRDLAALGEAVVILRLAQAAEDGAAFGLPFANAVRREYRPAMLARRGWQPPAGMSVTALLRSEDGAPAAVLVEAEAWQASDEAVLADRLDAGLAAVKADRGFQAVPIARDPHVPRIRCIVMPRPTTA